MTDDWTVTVPTEGDAARVARPIRACGLFPPEEADGFVSMLPEMLADPDAHWRTVERGGETLGAAYLSLERMSEDVWNLWFIGISAGAQGQGGGSVLLAEAERIVRDGGGRLLLVETSSGADQAAARGFYAARGYEPEGRIRDYYAPGKDKVIFRRAL